MVHGIWLEKTSRMHGGVLVWELELEHQGLMDLTFYGYELEEGNLPSSIWLLLPHSHMMNILTEPTRTQCPGPCGKVGTRRDTVSWA